MAVITATTSGLWSTAATWGGTGPADGDSVIIPTAINVVMDADLSAWTGLLNIQINGHATAPGQLTFKAGTSGYLKQRTGYTIKGTTGTLKGRIVCNNSGVYGETVALPFADKAVILCEGTSYIDATYLDIRQYPFNPTNPYVRTYGTRYTVTVSGNTFSGATLTNTTPIMIMSSGAIPAPLIADRQYYVINTSGSTFQLAYTSAGTPVTLTNVGSGTIEVYTGAALGTTAINVFEDVTADTAWNTTTDHNRCCLINRALDLDQQRTTIITIAAGVITLAAAADSTQRPGARLYLTSRNISNRQSGADTSAVVSYATGGVFSELLKTASSGTTFYGYGLNNSSYCSGSPVGCSAGFLNSSNCTGDPISCSMGFSVCQNCSGNPTGCTIGFNNSHNCSGNPIGCANAFSSSPFSTGNPISCGSGFYASSNFCTGNPVECATGFRDCSGCSGNPVSCVIGFQNTVDCSSVSLNCQTDINFNKYATHYWRNNALAPIMTYRNTSNYKGRLTCENHLCVNGAHKIYDVFGDITKVTCGAGSPVPASGPGGVSGDCLEASSIQSTNGTYFGLDVIQKNRINVTAGTKTITYKTINSFSGGITVGKLKLTIEYTDVDGVLTTVTTSNSGVLTTATDWSQTIASTITCAAGWITVTLTLWQYDATVPLLYVWPIPVIS